MTNIENEGMKFCNNKSADLTEQELKSIVKLYTSIFYARLLRNKIRKASDLGLIVYQISKNVRCNYFQILILSQLIYVLMLEYRCEELIPLLKELSK